MAERVCSEQDIPQGECREFQVQGEKVLVFHLSDGFYATQPRCTHMWAPLKKGKLDDKCIQCPFHRARFDVRTGEVEQWANFPPGIQVLNPVRGEKSLKTWPVRLENGEVLVEI